MQKQPHAKTYQQAALLRYARVLGFGDIHFKMDQKTGLEAIIAIHSTQRGPAIGGCRFYPYRSSGQALKDALRLAYMMTLKAAVSNLPHGGAKSVIIAPRHIKDRAALFHAFGDFVHDMNGRYITAMDVGTSTTDMDHISERTPHVIGAAGSDTKQEDPSPYTATGVLLSIKSAVKFKYDRDTLDGLTVAIQGAGKVGYHLAKGLHEAGAKIITCDPNKESTDRFADELSAQVVGLNEIYDVNCDIFSPCALGGTINTNTIHRIQANIIAGSANNQFSHRKIGNILHDKGVLYAPDYMINAGGLIQAASIHDYHDINIANELIDQLYDRTLQVYERSKSTDRPTTDIVDLIAREKLSLMDEKQEVETV
jgi:leucine dehydrogenase